MDTSSLPDIARCLQRNPLFADLDDASLRRIAESCELRQVERRQDVFVQGTLCQEFYIVVHGQIKLYALSPGGQEKIIEIVSDGHSFAEALMFLERPYAVSAQALKPSLVVRIPRHAMLAELARDNRVAQRMLAGLSRRLHGLISDVKAYSLDSGEQRVIGYLLRGADDAAATGAPVRVVLGASKASIASRLSITPEYFSRVLRRLEELGLIETDGRDVHIADLQRLRDHGGPGKS